MIARDQLIEIGRFLKTHGIGGELNFDPLYDLNLTELKCIVLEMDGIPVPFFVEKVRPKGADSQIVKVEGIDSDNAASELSNKTVYALTDDVDISGGEEEDSMPALALVGYTMIEAETGKVIGIIDHIDDSTQNWLFMVDSPDSAKLIAIPIADEFITDINPSERALTVSLPSGLLEL